MLTSTNEKKIKIKKIISKKFENILHKILYLKKIKQSFNQSVFMKDFVL